MWLHLSLAERNQSIRIFVALGKIDSLKKA